jgi:hypothetical protein
MNAKHVDEITSRMHEYQKQNNVKQCCVTNVQIFMDLLRSKWNVKAMPCVVVSPGMGMVHLIVYAENKHIMEPSYDMFSTKPKEYVMTLKDLFTKYPPTLSNKKWFVEQFLQFQRIADEINRGDFCWSDNKVYFDQWDIIEAVLPRGKVLRK